MFLGLWECPAGYMCPNFNESLPDTYPQFCAPDARCYSQRILGKTCTSAMGVYDPIVCPSGKYCPDAHTSYVCPAGSYCPIGTTSPLACAWYMSCPEASVSPLVWGSILITLLIDSCVLTMIVACLCVHNGRVRIVRLSAFALVALPFV